MTRHVDIEALRALIGPVAEGLGYDLVDLAWKHESGSWVLRLFIDRLDGGGVGLEDCSRVSRVVSAELDVADPIPVAYQLEVSSPGLNRPLRREADFRKFVGKKVKVRTRHPVGDATRRNFTGTLRAVAEGRLSVEVDGRPFEIPIDDVEKANLEYELEDLRQDIG